MSYFGLNATYTCSAKYSAVTPWAATTAATVGQIIRQLATPTLNNERCFVCIGAGTSGTTEPSWNIGRGNKTTDSTVTWIEATGLAALNKDAVSGPNWITGARNTFVDLGHTITDAAGTHVFICTTAGNVNATTEPTWNTSAVGNTTTDASGVWTYLGLVSSFTAWGSPHARLHNAMATNWGNNGNNILPAQHNYVGSTHAETQTSSLTWNSNGSPAIPLDILCVNEAGSLPPVSADLRTTATISTTGGNAIGFTGAIRCMYGITFGAGTTGNNQLAFQQDNFDKSFEQCVFKFGTGVSNGTFEFNGSTGYNFFHNCTFAFISAGTNMTEGGYAEFDNCTFNGTSPSSLFVNSGNGGRMTLRGCDLSAFTGTQLVTSSNNIACQIQFRNCKLPASYTLSGYTFNSGHNECIYVAGSDGSGHTYEFSYADYTGRIDASPVIARSGGAQDNSTPISWQCATTANSAAGASELRPPAIAQWNATVGSSITATVYGIINAAAPPTNLDAYLDVDYLGTTGNTIGSRQSSRVADFLTTPAALTADTSSWTAGSVATRANSTTYALGNPIKLASNPNRVFFCTTAGTSTTSEPGGYASAVDGGSVTDGSAVFRAGCRFSMSVTLTAQIAGLVYAQIKFTKQSVTCFFDPLLSL